MTPEPLDAQAHARIKTRLLRRLASEATPQHLTRHADSNDWQRFGHGLSMKVLHEAGGIMSYLVRLAPGWPWYLRRRSESLESLTAKRMRKSRGDHASAVAGGSAMSLNIGMDAGDRRCRKKSSY